MFCALLLLPLTLASYLYGLIVAIRSALYKAGVLKSHTAECRVITVGNLTVGGTGKTPMVCRVAARLNHRGFRTVVLCRGYRGQNTNTPLIVSDQKNILADAVSAGDEAFMLAQKLPGTPVIAAKDRVRAARMACDRFAAQVIVLDDGFQYFRLKRDLDIVLVNAQNPFGNGFLLPRGILREPLAALERANIIILTKTGPHNRNTADLEQTLARYNPKAPVFKSFYRPVKLIYASDHSELSLDSVSGKKVTGFCSIGDPDSFFTSIQDLGLALAEKRVFPDHHRYSPADCQWLKTRAEHSDYLMTTEKDIAKIGPDVLQVKNLIALEVEEVVDKTELFFEKLI